MSLNLRKASRLTACGHLPRRPLMYVTYLFNPCIRLSYFPSPWKEVKVVTLLKPCKGPKSPQNLRPIILLTTMVKIFEKVIQKIVQRHTDERSLLNTNQFGSRARHSTTLQSIRPMDHVTLNFNNNQSTTAIYQKCLWYFLASWVVT